MNSQRQMLKYISKYIVRLWNIKHLPYYLVLRDIILCNFFVYEGDHNV